MSLFLEHVAVNVLSNVLNDVWLSLTVHFQSGHPTKQKAENIVESPVWVQRWHITFDNLWKIKSDDCQLYLVFLLPPCWAESSNLTLKHPLWPTHSRQAHYWSLANQRSRCSVTWKKSVKDNIMALNWKGKLFQSNGITFFRGFFFVGGDTCISRFGAQFKMKPLWNTLYFPEDRILSFAQLSECTESVLLASSCCCQDRNSRLEIHLISHRLEKSSYLSDWQLRFYLAH